MLIPVPRARVTYAQLQRAICKNRHQHSRGVAVQPLIRDHHHQQQQQQQRRQQRHPSITSVGEPQRRDAGGAAD